MAHVFTSLRHPVEKLLEAEHFLGRLTLSRPRISVRVERVSLGEPECVVGALKSHVFSGRVPSVVRATAGIAEADVAARFFLELRNVSQKAGASFVCWWEQQRTVEWTYRFVGRPLGVPDELVGHDIGLCCAQHLVKLASLIRECPAAFPP
ncbi:MAG: hypothetical protein IPG56_18655 [Caulobacteraceae bacterium]|nr:hypothetical protein [Caulobacteraceae bacterium]